MGKALWDIEHLVIFLREDRSHVLLKHRRVRTEVYDDIEDRARCASD